jgi:hypothetical protein
LGRSFSGKVGNKASAAAMRSVYLAVHASLDTVTGCFSRSAAARAKVKNTSSPHCPMPKVHRDAHEPHIVLCISAVRRPSIDAWRERVLDERFIKALPGELKPRNLTSPFCCAYRLSMNSVVSSNGLLAFRAWPLALATSFPSHVRRSMGSSKSVGSIACLV